MLLEGTGVFSIGSPTTTVDDDTTLVGDEVVTMEETGIADETWLGREAPDSDDGPGLGAAVGSP